MGFGWQEIDKTLDLGYIRVAEGQGETAETAEMAETVEILSESICHTLFDPTHISTRIYYGHTYQSSLLLVWVKLHV